MSEDIEEIVRITSGTTTYDLRDLRIITLSDNSTTTAGTWLAKSDYVTSYVDGQLYLYKVTVAGASTTTLNINSLGAKTIYRSGSSKLTTQYAVGSYLLLAYNSTGTCFRVLNDYDANSDSNTIPAAYCTTAAATAAKVATHTSYVLRTGNYELITIVSSNTAKSALTLNINSTGAKPIYINGVVSSSSNYTLPGGTYIIYYDGTNYYFRTDGAVAAITTSGSGNAITSISSSGGKLTATKGSTFLTSHQDISGKANKSGDTFTGAVTFNSNITVGGTITGNKTLQFSDSSNPNVDLSNNGVAYYMQGYDGKVGLGPTWSSATIWDASGNMAVYGSITVNNGKPVAYVDSWDASTGTLNLKS